MSQLFLVGIRAGGVGLAVTLVTACILAQTAPCGRTVLRTGGDSAEDRFVAAPFEHVKSSVVRALPAVAARLTKDEGSHIEAKIDTDLARAQKETPFGSEGMKIRSSGTFKIDLAPATQDGVSGTRLAIRFSKGMQGRLGSGKYATPLADETACLVTLLSPVDPSTNPRGTEPASAQSNPRPVNLKANTPVKVALRNYLYTKEVPKDTQTLEVTLEAVEDVRVDGVVVIRRGALAKGRVSSLAKSKSFGRRAAFRFVVESATAVDGQDVALDSEAVERKGTSSAAVAVGIAIAGLSAGLFKGDEALVRAGTLWDIPTAKDIVIEAAQ